MKKTNYGTPMNGGNWPSLLDQTRNALENITSIETPYNFYALLNFEGRCIATSSGRGGPMFKQSETDRRLVFLGGKWYELVEDHLANEVSLGSKAASS